VVYLYHGVRQLAKWYLRREVPGDLIADDDRLDQTDDGELPEFLADIAGPSEVRQSWLDDL